MQEISLKVLALRSGIHCNTLRDICRQSRTRTLKPLLFRERKYDSDSQLHVLDPQARGGAIPTVVESPPGQDRDSSILRRRYRDRLAGGPAGSPVDPRPPREALARAHRAGRDLALLLVGIDHEGAGVVPCNHGGLDTLLVEVTERLCFVLAGGGTIARVSETLFAVTMSCEAAVARRFATRILDALARPFSAGGAEVRVNAAVGVSAFRAMPPGPTSCSSARSRRWAPPGAPAECFPIGAVGHARRDRCRCAHPGATGWSGRPERTGAALSAEVRSGHRTHQWCRSLVRWRHPELGLVERRVSFPSRKAADSSRRSASGCCAGLATRCGAGAKRASRCRWA